MIFNFILLKLILKKVKLFYFLSESLLKILSNINNFILKLILIQPIPQKLYTKIWNLSPANMKWHCHRDSLQRKSQLAIFQGSRTRFSRGRISAMDLTKSKSLFVIFREWKIPSAPCFTTCRTDILEKGKLAICNFQELHQLFFFCLYLLLNNLQFASLVKSISV